MTAGDSLAKNKAEALQGYLLNLRKNGVAVSGGIIVKDSKGWFINNKTTYRYDSSMADWDKFEI
jgi:hypothetical protein